MTREIKFRVWDGEDMISPDYIDRQGYGHWKSNSIPNASNILMQYTGLKDKNGKEVYEGDIVKLSDSTTHCSCSGCPEGGQHIIKGKTRVIEWHSAGFYTENSDITGDSTISPYGFASELDEIIGNVHENPELIKGDNNE